MKWKASWWGIQILAETEEEKKVLNNLCSHVPERAVDYYDDGVFSVVDPDSENYYSDDCFTDEEIRNSKITIQFNM